jgi:hypothetical protein
MPFPKSFFSLLLVLAPLSAFAGPTAGEFIPIGDCTGRVKPASGDIPRAVEFKNCVLENASGDVRLSDEVLNLLHWNTEHTDAAGRTAYFTEVDVVLRDARLYRGRGVKRLRAWVQQGGAARLTPGDDGSDDLSAGIKRYVSRDGKVGFMSLTLEPLLAPQFDWASGFENGTSSVCNGCEAHKAPGGHGTFEVTGGMWSEIDSHFQLLEAWHSSLALTCGKASAKPVAAAPRMNRTVASCDVRTCATPDVKRTFVPCFVEDDLGELHVVDEVLRELTFDMHGLASIDQVHLLVSNAYAPRAGFGGVAAWVTRTGSARLVPIFDNGADSFAEGLVRYIASDGKMGFADRRLEVAIAATWDHADRFESGFAPVCDACVFELRDEHYALRTPGSWRRIDRVGRSRGVIAPARP